jgi:hypothetical protein
VFFAVFCVAVLEGVSLAMQDIAATFPLAVPAMYIAPFIPILIATAVLLRRPRRRATNNAPQMVTS